MGNDLQNYNKFFVFEPANIPQSVVPLKLLDWLADEALIVITFDKLILIECAAQASLAHNF